MRLKLKILLYLSAFLLSLVGGIYLVAHKVISEGFLKVERYGASLAADRTLAVIENAVVNLDQKLADWAHWDESYAFFERFDRKYVASNWNIETFQTLQQDFGLISDLKGKILLNRYFDFQNGSYGPISEKLIEALNLHEITARAGLLQVDGKRYIVAIRPVLPSTGQGTPRGLMVFGRELTDKTVTSFGEILRLPIEFKDYRGNRFENAELPIIEFDDEFLDVSFPLFDLRSAPIAEVTVHTKRLVYFIGQRALDSFGWILLIMGILTIVVVTWFIDRTVVNRIETLTAFTEDIEKTQDLSQRLNLESTDEIATLGRAFNKLIETIEKERVELDESRQRLQFALDSSSGGVWDWDLRTNDVKYDSHYKRMLGYEDHEVANHLNEFVRLAHPDDGKRVLETAEAYIRGELPSFCVELRMKAKDGSYRWIRSEGTALRDRSGHPIRLIGWHRDITDSKMAQMLIEQQQAQLMQTSKMSALGEMSGGVAHEINNPLTVIRGYASQLLLHFERNQVSQEKAEKYLKHIVTMSDRIANIVRSLRNFSRDGSQDPLSILSANQIVEETLTLCQERFRAHEIDLKIDEIPPDVKILGRANELEQILINLLNNAFDAVNQMESPWIRIRGERSGDKWNFIVENAGDPIPSHVIERIFEPFFTTKEVGKGTGLGLSISKGLAEANQGSLTYDPSFEHVRFILSVQLAEAVSNHQTSISHRSV